MSKAYICDKCGRIVPSDFGEIHTIWIVNPHVFSNDDDAYHLCNECYEQFKTEYLANLRENGGVE